MVAKVKDYVEADSEEEAIKMIKSGDYDDILDEDLEEPISNINITGYEDEILYKLIDLEAGHTVGTSEYIPIKRIRDELDKILEEYK